MPENTLKFFAYSVRTCCLIGAATIASSFGVLAQSTDSVSAQNITAPGQPIVELLEEIPENAVSTDTNLQPNESSELAEASETPPNSRDIYWKNEGYDLQWSDTPTKGDYGKTGVQFFEESHFTNGHNLVLGGYQETDYGSQEPSQVSFVELDGIAAMRVFVPADDRMAMSVTGHQLPDNKNKDAVYSYRRLTPCGYGRISPANRRGGLYIGSGLYWGSSTGSIKVPGGSTNYDNSWSVRSPLGAAGFSVASQDILYVYPSRENTNTQPGLVIGGSGPTIPCDVWQVIEVEVIQNNPASASNGQINLYIDSIRTVQYTGQLRSQDDVYPKGFGIFIQLRGPTDQIIYQSDWKSNRKSIG